MKTKKPTPRTWLEIFREKHPEPNEKFKEYCFEFARNEIEIQNRHVTDGVWMDSAGTYARETARRIADSTIEEFTAELYCYLYMRAHSGDDPHAAARWNDITGDHLPIR